MGYKSTLRSIQSASNAAARESEREQRKLQREHEKIENKITKIEEKRTRITEALNDFFARGKINKETYLKLLERENDITLDLLVFGKSAAVSAAKRYICGKIEKDEFEELCNSFIPSDVFKEKQKIIDEYNNLVEAIKNFKNQCDHKIENECRKCGKRKGLFSPISDIDGLKLCGKCKRELNSLLNYKGFDGIYFYVSSCVIPLNKIEDFQLRTNIQQSNF